MARSFAMKTLLSRAAAAILVLAALYLILVNLALNLPTTRAYLNGIQPDRFAVSWERAWSLYPLRIELVGLATDGQTPSEQWQLDAKHAAASVSLLPLVTGEIRVHDLDLSDVDLRLRPRPKPGDDRGTIAGYFPVIRNRDPNAAAEPVAEEDAGALVLEIDDIHVKGEHDFWVSHIRGSLPGEVRGSFRMDTRAGQFSLAGGALDLALASLKVGPEEPVTDDASIKGKIEIPPFTLSHTKGLELFRLPELDARIDLPVQDLDFLALLMPPLGAMELSGRGSLRGRVVLSGGEALRGTDLVVEAPELGMSLGPYHFSGAGLVELVVDPADESRADLVVRFDRVRAALAPDVGAEAEGAQVLFSGQGLTARLHAAETDPTTTSSAERPEELLSEVELKLTLEIPSMQVPDLAVYNRLFPQAWDLELLGGTGTLHGALEFASDALSLDLDLASDEADLRVGDDRATTDLLLQLRARVDDTAGPTLHLNGTSVRIEDAEVAAIDGAAEESDTTPWRADFRVSEGALSLSSPAKDAGAGPNLAVAKVLEERGFGALLSSADGRLIATLDVSDLDWIAELLDRPKGLRLNGSGAIDARIVLADGLPTKGTDLIVKARDLSMTLAQYRFAGDGLVELRFDPEDAERGDLIVRFDEVQAFLLVEPDGIGDSASDSRALPLFSGKGLETVLHSEPHVESEARDKPGAIAKTDRHLSMTVPSMKVPDLGVYNRLLPAKWGARLLGGQGEVGARLVVDDRSMNLELNLSSAEADIRLEDDRITTDLALTLRAKVLADTGVTLDLSGTELRLDQARVTRGNNREDRPWQAALSISEGLLEVPVPAATGGADPAYYLTEILSSQGFGALLTDAHGQLAATLTVSRLGWIPRLLDNPLGLTLSGAGKIEAHLLLADGWLAKGTTLEVEPQDLALGLLDHLVSGRGHATLTLASGGRRPDLQLDAELLDARLRRQGEQRTEVDRMRLEVGVLAADVTADGVGKTQVDLRIPSARIEDMGVLNAYLPSNTPVKLLSGEASLIGDLQLAPDRATGELLLRAQDLRVGLDREELSGDIRLDVLISDGAPEDMRFDISGSQLVLDAFRIVGETASYGGPDWNAHLQIEKAELVWEKPLHLKMRALTTVKDTRPFLALLDNVRREHGWIDGLLEAEDLAGHVELVLDGEQAVLSEAMIGSEKINVGAKGRSVADGPEGLVYVRWNNLTGALALDGKDRHFHLFDARGKFDAYVPGRTDLPGQERSAAAGSPGVGEASTGVTLAPPEARKEAATKQDTANVRDATSDEDVNPFLNEDL